MTESQNPNLIGVSMNPAERGLDRITKGSYLKRIPNESGRAEYGIALNNESHGCVLIRWFIGPRTFVSQPVIHLMISENYSVEFVDEEKFYKSVGVKRLKKLGFERSRLREEE